jgi:glutamate dehydrogenase
MTAILKAQADLLWFGGIGTYIKALPAKAMPMPATAPMTPFASMPASDRVKVIGEGANLGLTQKARIEAGLHGVRLNTDAIDNSAGVNSSDLEVNIKIALGAAEAAGKLTREDRNALSGGSMTDEVASARAAQQLSADVVYLADRSEERERFQLSGPADEHAGGVRPARPGGGVLPDAMHAC